MDKTDHSVPAKVQKTRSQSGMQALTRMLLLVPFRSCIRSKDPIFDECNMLSTLIEEKGCQMRPVRGGILLAHNDLPNSSANDSYSSVFLLYDKPALDPIELTKALSARFDYARVEGFGNGIYLGICENLQTSLHRVPSDYMQIKEVKKDGPHMEA